MLAIGTGRRGNEHPGMRCAVARTDWNLTRGAEALSLTFRSMRYNVKKYNLSRADDGRQKRAA